MLVVVLMSLYTLLLGHDLLQQMLPFVYGLESVVILITLTACCCSRSLQLQPEPTNLTACLT